MRVLVQRVTRAAVRVAERVTGSIDRGYLVLVGFTEADGRDQVDWMADKVAGLRLFGDAEGRMNLGLAEADGAVLLVSQFTLYGDASRGRRPSFVAAARPEHAIALYDTFRQALADRGLRVATGEFGASMQVELVNDGPVTLWIER